jgi:hypothetical protein
MMRDRDRKAVDQPVRLHPNAWSSLEVRLIDCSETGFRAHCEARVCKYDEVTLELPELGAIKASVAWASGQEFGARFLAPIPIERVPLTPAGDQQVLARLLVQRASAHKSMLWEHEERLRGEIARKLPVQRG